jgi:hypothetical protein
LKERKRERRLRRDIRESKSTLKRNGSNQNIGWSLLHRNFLEWEEDACHIRVFLSINYPYDVKVILERYMTDLLLRFSPETTIRGTTTLTEYGQAFSVYDLIDVTWRPDRQKQHGNFSRRVWSRLISKQSVDTNEIKNWSFEAPIRKSVKVNRKFQCPMMTVVGLRKLCDVLKEKNSKFIVDCTVVPVLERYITGDRSMIEEIQMNVTESVVGGKRTLDHVMDSEVKVSKKKKKLRLGMRDLLLELTDGTTVRGTTAPDAPFWIFHKFDVPGEVFSIFDFIDVVCRQLSKQWIYTNISKVMWKRLLATSKGRDTLRYISWEMPMRCSLHSNRRAVTPVMGVHGLHLLLNFIDLDSKPELKNPHRLGRKTKDHGLDYSTRCSLEEIFTRLEGGDRSMIREIEV